MIHLKHLSARLVDGKYSELAVLSKWGLEGTGKEGKQRRRGGDHP